jgi:RNA polymerase sigma-70 factor (ECF subfamily)
MVTDLAEVAAAHAAGPLADQLRADPGATASLRRTIDQARAAWPSLEVADGEFVAFIAERAAADGPASAVLEPPHAADLYLACACTRGDPRAIAAFERLHLPKVPGMLARLSPTRELVDEVQQVLRTALFVAEPGKRPRIGEYGGRGKLESWLRIGALREGLRILERSPRVAELDADAPAPGGGPVESDPELRYMRRLYGDAFRRAFRAAFGELSPGEQALLRGSFLEGLAIDRLAERLGTHRATAARRLARARQNLLLHTRKALAAALGVDRAEVDSILAVLDTGLEASVRELLEK